MRKLGFAVSIVSAMALGSPSAFGQAADSLNGCQKAVAKEGSKYIRSVADTISKCLYKTSTAVVVDGGAAGDAAGDCVKQLLKLTNTADPSKTLSGKFEAKVGKACDPAINPDLAHTEADTYTVGATTLSAANLDTYCQSFGGSGTIASFNDWRDCIRAAADCQARQAIATQWPRALEYTEALLAAPEISGNADALAALTEIDAALEGSTNDNVPQLACGPPIVNGALKKTGQTQCDQGAGTMGACPGSPAGQDPAISTGVEISYTDNGDGTITDNATGLMWEKLSDDGTIHDKDTPYTWYTAFSTKIAALNAGSGFANHTDWRLPNLTELESVRDDGRSNPAMDPIFDTGCAFGCTIFTCSCNRPDYYWSSTTFAGASIRAWSIYPGDGDLSIFMKSSAIYVRAVRGGL